MASETPPTVRHLGAPTAPRIAWAPVLATVLLLCGLAVEVSARARPGDVEAYHARMRDRIASVVPISFGEWLGNRVDSSPEALTLLKPNAFLRRDYTHLRLGQRISVLVVHCGDARDLLGHFPPRCYPAHGLTATSSARRRWDVGGIEVEATRYRFSKTNVADAADIVVDNFMILPTGATAPDMDDVDRMARDVRMRHLGAAQVQLVTDGRMEDALRDAAFRELVDKLVPLLESADLEVPR